MSPIRIVLVDDEPDFRQPVARYLRKQGMEVHEASSIEDLTAVLSEVAPDLIVLDVGLPGESGLEAVNRLRHETGAGVVMVTARGGLDDRIDGLERGADSYLCKPVSMRELEAVLLSVWRRVGGDGAAARASDVRPAEAEWIFDAETWTLVSPDGEAARLSAAEYSVLSMLTATPGHPVSRDQLFNALNKPQNGPEDRSLDVLISRLRRKFSTSAFKLPVQSVRGVGYVFPLPVSQRPGAVTSPPQ